MCYPLIVVSLCLFSSEDRCEARLAPKLQSPTLPTHSTTNSNLNAWQGSYGVRKLPTCRGIFVMRGDVVQVYAGGVRGAGPPGTMGGGRSGAADAAGSHRLGHIRTSPGHQYCRLLRSCRHITRLTPADGARPTMPFVAQCLTFCCLTAVVS